MDKAKAKVGEFLHKSGKHDTTVHESVAPAVTHETVRRQEHDVNTTAIDREVHQDHFHTSVQPVQDRQIQAEQHHFREGDTQVRDHRHGDDPSVRAKLQQQQAGFRDQRTEAEATRTREDQPVLTGEHQHHHVHEVIQPVVQRETIQPHVVHSVNKIHEKHDKPAQVHGASTLPAMNLHEFKGQGGTLHGREERVDSFPGEPHNITGQSGTGTGSVGLESHDPHSSNARGLGHNAGSGVPGTGIGGTGIAGAGSGHHHGTGTGIGGSGTRQRRSSSLSSSDLEGTGKTRSSKTGTHTGTTGTHTGTTGTGTGTGKPSLMDKLNPKVDSNNDGKPGFMK